MPDTPTFGRYAEIPYEQMTPERQEGYRFLKEVRGQVGGPSKIWVHNPQAGEGRRAARRPFPPRPLLADRTGARDRRLHHQQQMAFDLSDKRA